MELKRARESGERDRERDREREIDRERERECWWAKGRD